MIEGNTYHLVLEASLRAISTILTVDGILILLFGTFIGLFSGALPGFGGILGLALVFPFVYQLSPELGFLVMAATLGGAAFGGSLPAITLNVPGLPANIATCWDGNKMAQKGELSRAIGVSSSASAFGAVFGLVLFVITLPVLREVVLLFSSPEIFTVGLIGLMVIALVTRDAPGRGMIALFLGLSIAFIGVQEATNVERFTLVGELSRYLFSGLNIVPLAIGLYAIGEAMRLAFHVEQIGDRKKGESISESERFTVFDGVRDTFKHKSLFFRSSGIGWICGLIPGVGGTFANVLAYTQGRETSKDPDQWGTGIPEGVIAPEASNDAKDGAAVIPTITFGIPGSGAQVFFLAGMTANGLFPGTDMLVDNLHITMMIIFGLLFSNIVTSTFGLFAGGFISRIMMRLRPKPIVAIIVLLSLLGAFTIRSSMYDVYATVFFGVVGYLMWRYGYPRILLIIAFVLGPIIDVMFSRSIQIFGPTFLLRPIPLLVIAMAVVALLWRYRRDSARISDQIHE